ncbi:MAG: DUF1028 domain-containing protein [Bacteroidetes bacterium]|nr:DUF1028 domain-containing protein [Bacteroidota bacterium]
MKVLNNHLNKLFFLLFISIINYSYSQHTFSIVAVDSNTGKIGSAGATCLDIDDLSGEEGALVISDIILGIGAIHSQAYWSPTNQIAARIRMEAGDSPQEIIDWLFSHDPAPGTNQNRQYGIVDLIGGVGGTPRIAAFTGNSIDLLCSHIVGPNYAIQGNYLSSLDVLDDMETEFLNATGTLADKLMAAMQGSKRVGAQSSCTSNQTSSKSAFLRVAKTNDLFSNYGHLTIDLNVSKTNYAEDPIDVLQTTYDYNLNNLGTDGGSTVTSFPYTESFEIDLGLWEQNDLDLSHVGSTDFDWIKDSDGTPTSGTGPYNASDGSFYLYTEASSANVGYPAKRAVLNSPCFDLNNIADRPTLSFDYHMAGTDIGNLAVRVNDGSGWTTIWLIHGNQGNQWNEAELSLEDYSGQNIQIRMDATTGLGSLSDIAIDNISVFADALVGIENSELALIQISPNPTQADLNVSLSDLMATKTKIYDLNGRVVSELNITSQNYKVDVSGLKTGMYFVEIATGKGIATKLFIKQ